MCGVEIGIRGMPIVPRHFPALRGWSLRLSEATGSSKTPSRDDRGAARGIVIGVLISFLFWVILSAVL
jgi:hypothetical protein